LDIVEELGRTKPRTVSELMEIAKWFADREDSYHSKRARLPEYVRSSRQRNQRHRSHNGEGDEQKNDEYHKKDNYIWDRPKYSDPSAKNILHGPCPSTMRI
jgi:hypothetical protein